MTWWCTATRQPWDWAPRAYPGIWLAMAVLLATYLLARRADARLAAAPAGPAPATGGADAATGSRRRLWAFLGGWVALWAVTDWPLGALGSGYLASAHMVQYLGTTLVAAPLLLLGTSEAMMRRVLARTRTERLVALVGHPVAAGLVFNAVMAATHAPVTVDALRSGEAGSFLLDVAWLASGLLLWLPICGPLPELRPGPAARGAYLFLAAGLVPMIPGGFLTFAATPLYATYELAPRVGGFDAVTDQQLAGALMKVGSIPLIWPVIGVLFARWARESREPTPRATPAGRASPASPAGR